MKKIVPAILTKDKEELKRMLTCCQSFTDYVQIDIMDGKFVPSESIKIEELASLDTNINKEAHLMVIEPLKWLAAFKKIGTKSIIFHVEIENDLNNIIDTIHKNNMSAGLAINPSTDINNFSYLFDKIDSVLFMSVNPGFYGAEFIPEVLAKIKAFKTKYPNILTGIDGGVKESNIIDIIQSGVDYICIGSAILKDPDPKKAYTNFTKLVNERE